MRDSGVKWARQQVQELLDRGVPSLHLYVMQDASALQQRMPGMKQ